MALGFVYFLPGVTAGNINLINSMDLGYAFQSDDCLFDSMYGRLPDSPEIKEGIFVTFNREVIRPNDLEWESFSLNERDVFIGYKRGNLIKPETLKRKNIVPGNKIEDEEGRKWIIPAARSNDGATSFPRKLERQKDGSWKEGDVVGKHKSLFEKTEPIWDEFIAKVNPDEPIKKGSFNTEMSTDDMCDLCVKYMEIGILGILNTRTMTDILLALIDMPSIRVIRELVSGKV